MNRPTETKKQENAKKPTPFKTAPSPAVIRRLPRYYRYLSELIRENRLRISSQELADLMQVTASQIRQDLNCFGGFGQQGYGYNVRYLHGEIGNLLGVESGLSAVIVGAGHLGSALASSHIFIHRGIALPAIFDIDRNKIGTCIAGIPVYDLEDLPMFCRERKITIGVLTTPKEAAKEVVHLLTEGGVSGIWNFSNMELRSENGVTVENTHMGDALMTLCYAVKEQSEGKK